MHNSPATFDSELSSLTDHERRARSVRERRQRTDRVVLDSISSTFLGTLTELAETQAPITLLIRNESSIRGSIAAVANDVVVVATSNRSNTVLLRVSAIEALLEVGEIHGRRVESPADTRTFGDLLDEVAQSGMRIALTLASTNRVVGRLGHVGQDQIVLTLDGSGETMTVPTNAIDQAVVSP